MAAMKLTYDQEAGLRAYFTGALSTAGGDRSPMGAVLERLKYGLPRAPYADDGDNLDRCGLVVKEMRIVREALNRLPRGFREVLAICYSPVPIGKVWGLVDSFGGVDVASVAVHTVEIDVLGKSQWRALHELRMRAKGSPKAKDEFETVKRNAEAAIEAAKNAYALAHREVRHEMSAARRLQETLRRPD